VIFSEEIQTWDWCARIKSCLLANCSNLWQ